MVTKLVTVSPETDLFEGVRLLLRNHITGAPVIDSGRTYLGMLSEKSCIRALTEQARDLGGTSSRARDFMASELVCLRPDMDSFEAIALLLKNRYSGAPVIDDSGRFLGVFSERYSMRLLINSAYEQVPSTEVGRFMNTDQARLIDEDADLLGVAQIFLDSYFRRLPVLRGDALVGQISRRDVLRAEHELIERALEEEPASKTTAAPARLARTADYMDTGSQTIGEDTDFLTIAQTFLQSNRRRLPVLREGKLVGQISRRDLLSKVLDLMGPQRKETPAGLYLSALHEHDEKPILDGPKHRRAGQKAPVGAYSRFQRQI